MRRGRLELAAAAALAAACSAAPDGAPPEPARVVLAGGEPPPFAADAQAILAELEAWRGLRFREDLVVEVVPAETVEDPKLHGWYEPDTKRLVVVEGKTDRMGRGTLLHEMFHALQDQHFGLDRLHRDAETRGEDARRALAALIEGEAMLAVSEIMDYDFERHAHLPESGSIDPERFEKIFHYGEGLRFVRALREDGGWARVDAAFGAPPRTTAEIYRPERFLEGAAEAEDGARPLERFADATGVDLLRRAGAPRGELALRLFLAREEGLRPRLDEVVAGVVAEAELEGGVWALVLDDEATAREVLGVAVSQGHPTQLLDGGDLTVVAVRPGG